MSSWQDKVNYPLEEITAEKKKLKCIVNVIEKIAVALFNFFDVYGEKINRGVFLISVERWNKG